MLLHPLRHPAQHGGVRRRQRLCAEKRRQQPRAKRRWQCAGEEEAADATEEVVLHRHGLAAPEEKGRRLASSGVADELHLWLVRGSSDMAVSEVDTTVGERRDHRRAGALLTSGGVPPAVRG
jgi:hypothetical protein